MQVRKLDHVAIAVEDLRAAARLFIDVLGGAYIGGGDNPDIEVRAIQVRFPPDVRVELLTPTTETSYLRAYLDRHGEGFHHMTAYVDNVHEVEQVLGAAGYPTVGTQAQEDEWHETFTRPGASHGALLQFAVPRVPWTEPLAGTSVDDVLEGRIQVLANVVTWKASGERILPAEWSGS